MININRIVGRVLELFLIAFIGGIFTVGAKAFVSRSSDIHLLAPYFPIGFLFSLVYIFVRYKFKR